MGALVSATLPSSASLYTRRGAIVAINNSSADSTESSLLQNSTNSSIHLSLISSTFPFISSKIVSTEPATILLTSSATANASAAASSQSVIISPTSESDWIIPNRDSILAWTVPSLSSSPSSFFSSEKYGSIRATGSSPDPTSPINPQIALSARTAGAPILEVSLQENETIFLHPNTVLAYTIPSGAKKTQDDLVIVPHSDKSVSLSSVTQAKYFKSIKIPDFIVSYWNTLKKFTHAMLYQGDDLLLKVTGPKTILLASGGNANATALDPPVPVQKELEKMYQEIKNEVKEEEEKAESK